MNRWAKYPTLTIGANGCPPRGSHPLTVRIGWLIVWVSRELPHTKYDKEINQRPQLISPQSSFVPGV